MKILFLLLTVVSLQVFAEDFKETITISKKNASLKEIFRMVQKQSDYSFAYTDPMLSRARPVDIDVKNAGIEQVLSICFREQPLEYEIDNNIKVIIVKEKKEIIKSLLLSSDKKKQVKGKVTNENGEPVAGAHVQVKGETNLNTITDERGEFSLDEVSDGATLIISGVNIETYELKVSGRAMVVATVKVAVKKLDETIVVAYNTTTQRANTGSVTVVKGDEIEVLPHRSIDRALQGMVPGLLVTNGNGQPGGGVSNFIIRGIGTAVSAGYGSTVRNPLIVVDGVPVSQDHFESTISSAGTPMTNPMAQFNTNDIDNISVLKDAAAISLYGTRASNGVILITTKKGKKGRAKVSFEHQTDISERVSEGIQVLNQDQYLELLVESYRNLNSPQFQNDASIYSELRKLFPIIINQPGDTSFYPTTNWFKELYNNNAVTLSNNISISGGTEKGTYYVGFGYTNQDGVVKETGYDRASLRVNLESRPIDWFSFGVNSMFSYNKQTTSSASISTGYTISPLTPARLLDGSYNLKFTNGTTTVIPNPLAAMEYNISENIAYRQNSSIFGQLHLFKGLKLKTVFGFDFMLGNSKGKVDPRLPDAVGNGTGSVTEINKTTASYILTNTLNYDWSFSNKHLISFLAGQEVQEYQVKNLGAVGQNLSVPYFDQVSNGSITSGTGGISRDAFFSLFSQLRYNYKNKYFISGSARRDGSSKFGKRERFGNYWSLGAGWVVSDESFLKNSSSWLNLLKIRGSIGTAGNSGAISSISRFYQLGISNFGGNSAVIPALAPGNEDIRWEKTLNSDIGLELNLFNRINLTTDFYKRKTTDLIFSVGPVPNTGFIENYYANVGEMENRGIEFSISGDIVRTKKFTWNIGANWSRNKNKLVKAYDGFVKYLLDKPWDQVYIPRWAGVNPADGKPQWLDTSGKITSTYNYLANAVAVGKASPDAFGSIFTSISYDGLTITVTLYYQYGNKIMDNTLALLSNDGALYPFYNQATFALNRWQKPGDIAANPKRVFGNTDGGIQESTRYLLSGDYVQLKNVSLTYNLPARFISKFNLSNTRVFIQGYNLALWRNNNGNNPENTSAKGTGELAYPQAKTFSIGFNVSL